MINLLQWIADNHLNVKIISEKILEINDVGKFLIIGDQDQTFDDRFILNLTDEEIDLIDEVDYLLFNFGAFFFYQHKDDESKKLNFFRYLGQPSTEKFDNIPFLGVHGRYELCNGSRDYIDWCKKIKFLGYSSIAISEHQTLAGNYNFQKACDKYEIKAIHGRTCKIKSEIGGFYFVKSYAINKQGWNNLLKIHNIENVERSNNNQYITEEEFFECSHDLFHIISHETNLDNVNLNFFDKTKTFYQINPVKYKFQNKDEEHLLNIKKYIDNYLNKISPIVFQDAYYLDNGDDIVKPFLNKVIGKSFQFSSIDEWVKPYELVIIELLSLFNNEDNRSESILNTSFKNLELIHNTCDFVLKRDGMHLPKYRMNDDEKLLYASNEDMFFSLIEKGFKDKIKGKVEDEQIYIDRITKEVEVLQEGNVLDYFLILYDVADFSVKNGSIRNLGRGSAAGSLVSYLLGIVRIDPIKYNLLFERFLNKARLIGGSLPDIDFDTPSFFRGKIIEYLNSKYGKDNVACIGTAQNFKLKSTLKDLLKSKGVDFSDANFITSLLGKDYEQASFDALFEIALKEPKLKDILNKYPEIIYEIYLCIFQPRSYGIHAAGIVIFPDQDVDGNKTTASNYVPLRFSGEQLVTEWEKDAVEEMGLLKLDLLGLLQLDKIIKMNNLILENGKQYHEFEDIDLEDKKVFELFKNATTEDIFQFNTDVQKNYLLQLRADNIDELVAANALNRPGAMESNSHNIFIKIKDGKEEEKLPYLLEDILRPTKGMFTFQEQAMLSYQLLTECDLNEADNFRKVVSKSKPGKIDPNIQQYEKNFKESYLNKGADEELVDDVWNKIISFTSYAFNLSHAVSYAITGYWAAYYKAYFPVEFYAVSLQEAADPSRLINEIQSQQLTNLSHPDINKSGTSYSIDYKNNYIYWSLISISFAGEKAISTLLEERNTNGKYFSFEEFLIRSKNFKVNKRIINNFILAGCFDEIENIGEEKERLRLLEYYYKTLGEDIPYEIKNHSNVNKNFFWVTLQKQVCGLGNINYQSIYKDQKMLYWLTTPFMDSHLMQDESSIGKICVVGGILELFEQKKTKKGDDFATLTIDSNGEKIKIMVWNQSYEKYKNLLMTCMHQPILLSGIIVKNSYKNTNVIQTNVMTQITKT